MVLPQVTGQEVTCLVTSTSRDSGSIHIAATLMAHFATTYQAGAIGLCVTAMSHVTTNRVVPPNTDVLIADRASTAGHNVQRSNTAQGGEVSFQSLQLASH